MVIAPWKKENEETVGYYRAWIRSIEGFHFHFFLCLIKVEFYR
jgi:hypothetical protein